MNKYGNRPTCKPLRETLAALVPKREPEEVIVVHHYTDDGVRLRLEVERRSITLGIKFERVWL